MDNRQNNLIARRTMVSEMSSYLHCLPHIQAAILVK